MIRFGKHTVCPLAALLLCLACLAMAQTEPAQNIKKVPVRPTSAASGEEMYKQYCAVCHGKGGMGDGPAASELKHQPPDLTTLAKRHNGKFPGNYVVAVLRFGVKAPAHGTSEMPIWGPLFSSVSGSDKAQVQMREFNISRYLETLQAK